MSRRLAHGSAPIERYGWKPFGNYDYGYDKKERTAVSFSIWAFVTYGSFSVDPFEAALLLGNALYQVEKRDYVKQPQGTGASWVHNIQAGYCWYHYFVKGNRTWPLFLGAWSELAVDVGVVALDEPAIDHKAHYEGASIGMGMAFLFDLLRRKTDKNSSLLWKSLPFLAIGYMMWGKARYEDPDI